jgi:hypothetical protein
MEDSMRGLMLVAAIALALPAAGDTKLGAGVTLKDATAIDAIVERPQSFVGKTIRIDGVATAVCTHMGCWMAVAKEGDEKGSTVRVKVDDGVLVIPVTAKGKKVSAEGVFEAVGPGGDSTDAAAEHAKHDPKASQQYQLKASGAVIH